MTGSNWYPAKDREDYPLSASPEKREEIAQQAREAWDCYRPLSIWGLSDRFEARLAEAAKEGR
jgi:hypothetical protein